MCLQSGSTFQHAFPPASVSIDHKRGGSSTQVLELTKKSEFCDRKAQLEANLQSH